MKNGYNSFYTAHQKIWNLFKNLLKNPIYKLYTKKRFLPKI
jgi:hypothetical protein